MTTSSAAGRRLIYFLIFLSGVAGLIYQVVWHKYLSILLGAQARATAIVLAIFLGGISAGYACFGKWSRDKKWNLLFAYSIVEIALALWAMLFPYAFRLAMPLTSWLYVHLGVNSIAIDVLVSLALIGLPTFLMGGTLPLLTQGLSEDLADASKTHAKIYGFNTVGACVGSMLAGYVLIPVTDLPVTVTIGGMLNVLVGLVSYFAFAKYASVNQPAVMSQQEKGKLTERELLLFGIGFCSGFYVLSLETVLIRLMGLSTGSSNYNFTLIVSIFVFGLGFGSLFVRKIAKYTDGHLLWNQLGVAFFLLVLYISGDYWSYGVHLVRIIFRDTASNFYLYQIALGIAFLVLLIVPVGMCGFTLPLCFHLIKDRKETLGYRVGQLYGLNTLGCVAGALFGGYFLLNYIDLDHLFKVCIVVSLVGTSLAGMNYYRNAAPSSLSLSFASAVFSVTLVGVAFWPLYHKERFIQPFRQQTPLPVSYKGVEEWSTWLSQSTTYLYYKDGPNTSVGIGVSKMNDKESSRTIFVNGKSDGNTRGDFLTMMLTGHIPAVLARRLDRTCVIGHGTGLTIGAIAKYVEAKRIDVVEIADTILDNRHYFDPYNGEMSKSPKVHTHAMDAFRFLEGTAEKFDVIVSEPSNPWVAGVENLYSSEFYDIAKRKLTPEGLYVQWVQAYSFNEDLLKMVLRTVTSKFRHVSVFQMMEQDMAIVATDLPFTRDDLKRSLVRMANNPSARLQLEEGGINRLETLLAYEIMPASLTPFISQASPILSLESPRLSHGAAKAFFINSGVKIQTLRRQWKEFYPSVDDSLLSIYLDRKPLEVETANEIRKSFCDHRIGRNKYLCEESIVMAKWLSPKMPYENEYDDVLPRAEVREVASFRAPSSTKVFTDADLLEVTRLFDYYKRFYSPIAKLPMEPIFQRLDLCLAVTPKTRDLYGDCLLQKAAVTEVVKPEQQELLHLITAYGSWFGTISPDSPSYSRFKRAYDILAKVLNEMAGKKS